jgi:outer membrane autotransporter protein
VVRSELGSRFDQVFAQAGGSSVDMFGRVAWAHDWQSNPNLTATFIGLPAASFVVNGAAPPTNLALVTAGAEWRSSNGWSFMAKFDSELAAGSQTYTGTARVKYAW